MLLHVEKKAWSSSCLIHCSISLSIGTLPNEDPRIEIDAYPPQYVFYNEPMIFQVSLGNVGVGSFSYFSLSSVQTNGKGSFLVTSDGSRISEDSMTVYIEGDQLITKEVVVERGSVIYEDSPIQLRLQSKCE